MAVETPLAFFSYARDDSQFALQLAKDLKLSGAPVWLDQLDIHPGQRWDKAVEDALANCTRLLVILSPSSVDSTNVMDEVSFALEEQKTVIPVLHRMCRIPFRLRRVQYVDFRGEYDASVRELLKVMGVAAQDRVPLEEHHVADWPARLVHQLRRSRAPEIGGLSKSSAKQRFRIDAILKVLVWSARILALIQAAFVCYLLFTVDNRTDRVINAFLVPSGLAQMGAWKWEWQGSVVALTVSVAATIFGPSEGYILFYFAVPAMLFLIHWGLGSSLSLKV